MTSPNVVVILADDLGFSDLGCFGGEIETPHLDALAAEGVRMSAFYTTPRCSPSRAALLTGRHPHSVGVGILTTDDRPFGYPGSLTTEVPTVAERLRRLGYATALVGKWHLSSNVATPDETWPTRRGFDEFYGILGGASSYYQPPLRRGEERIEAVPGDGYYVTDDLSARALEFVGRAADAGVPFFLYLAYTAPHWPLHAPADAVARCRDRYVAGWDALREARVRRLERIGIAPPGGGLADDPDVPDWESASDRAWEAERMATYAAQVEIMDAGIGRVLGALEAHGVRDDTLVVFLSDNGASAEELPFSRVPDPDTCPPLTRDGAEVRVGNDPAVPSGPARGYSSYGRSWAHLSNAPFRLYKKWVHEGGIASPLIARWPSGGVVGGAVGSAPAHVIDLVPTIAEAVGDRGAADPGVSLLPVWRGGGAEGAERDLFWEHMGNAAVRRGRWKLVREALAPWELYDLDRDRGETDDVAARHPEIVEELARAWQEWADASGVLPWEELLDEFRRRGRALPGGRS